MANSKPKRLPKFRLHKHSGRAFVHIDRRRICLGPHDDPRTRERNQALVADWVASGYRPGGDRGTSV
jgi:hypothetical protein